MAIYRGTTPLASNGATPYVNPETNNWVIAGEDTGMQAFPDTIDVDEYSERFENGTLDMTRKYLVTGTSPRTMKNVVVSTSDWTGSNPAVASITVENLRERDMVNIAVSTVPEIDDDTLSKYLEAVSSAQIKRVVCENDTLKLMAYGDVPTTDIALDLIILKAIPN